MVPTMKLRCTVGGVTIRVHSEGALVVLEVGGGAEFLVDGEESDGEVSIIPGVITQGEGRREVGRGICKSVITQFKGRFRL